MGQKTPLYTKHLDAGAKIVDFAGWDMPLHYGSQIDEHHQVRKDAGVFDVSHMLVVDLAGSRVEDFLRRLLSNDVAKLKNPGKALYTCMLNPQGGVLDDLIVYKQDGDRYRLVINAGRREQDLAWIKQQSQGFAVEITPRTDLCILAIQGPNALTKASTIFPAALYEKIKALRPFEAVEQAGYFIGRTGYTGEEGVEVLVPASEAPVFWDKILASDIKPCGLGARDTLRLEAGLNLYGSDMDESTTPLESNLGWTVAFEPKDRDFIGRAALEAQKPLISRKLVGLVLEQKGVLRNHQKVIISENGCGEITSGSFSPTLQEAIALARIPVTESTQCSVEIRGQQIPARIVKPPFVRHGKKTFE
ncbi:MAG TPA: glycine cleavage system aminomethyltransferase GcvT [Gammaproteobacteria bacterium]|nr:glycine cleavage system aminomethyltransferase GcvT [Gammaproteobacteria bacterium]